MTIELRVWQLVALAVILALSTGVLFGRYAVPVATAPPGTKIDIPGGGTVYMSDEATRRYAAAKERAGAGNSDAAVRAAVPALEAWNADHHGYAGASLPALQSSYDAGVRDIEIVSASQTTYCIQSTDRAFSKHGPGAAVAHGGC